MTDVIADRIAQVAEIIHEAGRVPAPSRTEGDWIVWDQWASRKLHDRYVAELKAAGIPAFFRAGERRFGVKKA